jgi:hypothetical protein
MVDELAPRSSPADTASRWRLSESFRFAFLVWLCMRLVLSLWGAFRLLTISPAVFANVQIHYPSAELPGRDFYGYLIGVWNVYDAPLYTALANHGYGPDMGPATVFYPGYPLLIRAASFLLFGQTLLAALVVANVAAIIFFWYFYRLTEAEYGAAVARRAVIFSAIFPSCFFLFLPYTEAPLLAFTVMTFYYGRERRWLAAGLLAAGAALVKQQGLLLLVPLAYMMWQQHANQRATLQSRRWVDWLWLLPAPAAVAVYIAYRYLLARTWGGAPDLTLGNQFSFPGVPLLSAIAALRLDNAQVAGDVIDVAFALGLILLGAGALAKVRVQPYFLYSLVLLLFSLALGYGSIVRPEPNTPRRLIVIFPIFIFMALVTSRRRAFIWVASICAVGFLVLSGLFVQWVFVS